MLPAYLDSHSSCSTKPMVTSACNGTRNVAPSGEVFFELFSLVNWQVLDPGTTCWNWVINLLMELVTIQRSELTVTRDQPRRVLPPLVLLWTRRLIEDQVAVANSKGNPESSLMWKPQEQAVTERDDLKRVARVRRPHLFVEGAQRKRSTEGYWNDLKKVVLWKLCLGPVTHRLSQFQRSQMDTKTKRLGKSK